jgi:hypothetical protein
MTRGTGKKLDTLAAVHLLALCYAEILLFLGALRRPFPSTLSILAPLA